MAELHLCPCRHERDGIYPRHRRGRRPARRHRGLLAGSAARLLLRQLGRRSRQQRTIVRPTVDDCLDRERRRHRRREGGRRPVEHGSGRGVVIVVDQRRQRRLHVGRMYGRRRVRLRADQDVRRPRAESEQGNRLPGDDPES